MVTRNFSITTRILGVLVGKLLLEIWLSKLVTGGFARYSTQVF